MIDEPTTMLNQYNVVLTVYKDIETQYNFMFYPQLIRRLLYESISYSVLISELCSIFQETHIIHTFKEDFYGSSLKICMLGFLRPMKNFSSLGRSGSIH